MVPKDMWDSGQGQEEKGNPLISEVTTTFPLSLSGAEIPALCCGWRGDQQELSKIS